MPLRPLHVVWFKRDLRIDDHAPLTLAAQGGPVLPLYILEPELWRQPDVSGRHFAFLAECLVLLDRQLSRLGQPLVVRTGEAVDVLEAIRAQYGIAGLWSHEETGNAITFARDVRVSQWCKAHGAGLTEIPQNGVVRRLQSRDGWAQLWQQRMDQPVAAVPAKITSPAFAADTPRAGSTKNARPPTNSVCVASSSPKPSPAASPTRGMNSNPS
ncbi:MAG: deoxyribodipyrimidine photo-lyase [Hyphomicrobium aestuarii]|nr:deoxyribodipyrimidine photo-lyase [Hyphomicrobium aestuarii]